MCEPSNLAAPQVRSSPLPYQMPLWIILTLVSKEFATYLPPVTSSAAQKTFLRTSFKYDRFHTLFDNTILTWGTDYAIGVIMTYLAFRCIYATTSSRGMRNEGASRKLRVISATLLLLYAVSVLAGGIAHQMFTTIDSLNTTSFRILWTICVGTVTAAGLPMGMIGSELCRRLNANADESKVRFRMPIIPDSFWYIYAGYFTLTCILGGISYKRPACDIFAAGVSQFVPTAHNLLVLLSIRWDVASTNEVKSIVSGFASSDIKLKHRLMFCFSFLSNAPLLPVYPLLVQHTKLPLGVVNALLHLNLTLSWGMQGLCLRHFCKAMNSVKQFT